MSDARAAAFLCSIYGKSYLEKCSPSRWVYFSAKGTSIFGKWHKIDGVLYSNTYWRKREPEPAQDAPKRGEGIPVPSPVCGGSKPRLADLWDMSLADQYWRMLYNATPKPRKAN